MIFRVKVTNASSEALQRAILQQMKDACYDSAKVMREKHRLITANWKGKPDFKVYAFVGSRTRAEGRVTVGGPNAKKWWWVNEGVEERPVYAKTQRGMIFPYQGRGQSYLPKTTTQTFGGPGQRVGPITRRREVYRGIAARNFPGLARKLGEQAVWNEFGKRFYSR